MSSIQWKKENVEKLREYRRKYYEKNKESHYKRNKEKKERLKEIIKDRKKDGCIYCGEKCIPCLDFHHVNGDKDYNVSVMSNIGSLSKLLKELDKCVVVCANCHRKIHAGVICEKA